MLFFFILYNDCIYLTSKIASSHLVQFFSNIFQHLEHFTPDVLLTFMLSFFWSSFFIFSAFEVIKYSAKFKLFSNSKSSLLVVILISASRLDPISLLALFSSIAMFASCLILNNFSHFSLSFLFSQFFGISTKRCSCMLSSFFELIKLYISSVVKTKIGAYHLSRLSKIIFNTVTQSFLFLELKLSQ